MVELIVVISVVSVLAALLLPVISGVQAKSLEAKCSSNLRQLAAAEFLYAGEHNQQFTLSYTSTDPVVWQARLNPYIPTNDQNDVNFERVDIASVFNCPARVKYTGPVAQAYTGGASIGLNNYLNDVLWNYQSNRVPQPSKTILLIEMSEANCDYAGTSDNYVWYGYASWAPTPATRHRGKTTANAVFCDGHVEALTAAQTKADAPVWKWW